MTPEEFRRLGYRMVDFVADYWQGVGERPVLSRAAPGETLAGLSQRAPEQPGGPGEWEEIFADLERVILPGVTHWQHPSFFGYFPANASGPAVLGELLSAGLGVQGMLWLTSPACTELETRVLDWMAELAGLPACFRSEGAGGGVIQGTASEAALVALVAARARKAAGASEQVPSTDPGAVGRAPGERVEEECRRAERTGGTPVPRAGAEHTGGTPVPRAGAEHTGGTPVPRADAERTGGTPVPRAGAEHTGGTPVPRAGAERTGGTPVPRADAEHTGGTPVARASREREFTVYASEQTHSSIVKAAMIAGLADGPEDRRLVRLVETDAQGAMVASALEDAMRADVAAGLIPCFVCATVGTTATTAVDPVADIAAVIGRVSDAHRPSEQGLWHGCRPWLHVDAAHAGAACVCEEHRWMIRGVEHADSFCFNPHKWLLTNFDCDCFYVRDRRALVDALSVTPEYLRNKASDSGGVIDYRDWQIPLGRRFRALKLWFVMRHYGAEGLRAHVREGVRLAALFESLVRQDERFEVVTERTLNLVCFRVKGAAGEAADRCNRRLLDVLNASGRMFLTHATLPKAHPEAGRVFLRMAIGGTWTREEHVRGAWELICAEAGRSAGEAEGRGA